MLAIRLQRHGRKGYPTYRFIVQDSKRSPTSGKLVTQLGHYNPHTKELQLDKDKAKFYLDNGAQPSERIVKIFTSEGVKLPNWVVKPAKYEKAIKNSEKLRKNRPVEEAQEEKPVENAEEPAKDSQEKEENKVAEEPAAEDATTEELKAETSAEPDAEVASPEETNPPAGGESPAQEAPKDEKPAEK